MAIDTTPASDLERRKQVRLHLRTDLDIAPHRYEGRTYYIVKDPVSLRYYRFKEQEHFLIRLMDGSRTLDDAQKEFEKRFRPERLPLEDLEAFAQQLLTVGLAHNESPQAGKQLYDRRAKRRRTEWIAALTNILYIKLPLIDPDRLLNWMLPWLRFIFTTWFFVASVGLMLAALMLVLTHFETFRDKLPSYHEFFSFKTVAYMWIALGVVKVIHEFGHGLSCKAFGGEVHEMGALFLCLSPCLYCNVSDAWTMPNKWHRIIISFAGIYVELIIASIATFVWWNTPAQPFLNNLSLSLMIVCSVSTIIFNGNPLMRYDGYYVLADWLEIPNLRDRANRFLQRLAMEHLLGIEVQPEPYMDLQRRILFLIFAIASYIYRWVITFSILWFMSRFLPEKLRILSYMLAIASLGSLVGWPIYRLGKSVYKRGRLPDMKTGRVLMLTGVVVALLLFVFLVPLPVSRVRQTALIQLPPDNVEKVFVPSPGGTLEYLPIRYGNHVKKGDVLARFRNLDLENQREEARTEHYIREKQIQAMTEQLGVVNEPGQRDEINSKLAQVRGERKGYADKLRELEKMLRNLEVRAPRDGVVLSPPQIDEIGKLWDKEADTPLCSIGDPSKLWAVMPVPPADYRVLKDDLEHLKKREGLDVTIRVQGRADETWKGHVAALPESEARDVPIQLTTRAGGPLAVKPNTKPNIFIPQSQQYLVAINFVKPDPAICPGTLAQVKVHCQWRTCAWWVWRTISSTFDVGLI
jgi:putative peptide zinc metalloprotease protein